MPCSYQDIDSDSTAEADVLILERLPCGAMAEGQALPCSAMLRETVKLRLW